MSQVKAMTNRACVCRTRRACAVQGMEEGGIVHEQGSAYNVLHNSTGVVGGGKREGGIVFLQGSA